MFVYSILNVLAPLAVLFPAVILVGSFFKMIKERNLSMESIAHDQRGTFLLQQFTIPFLIVAIIAVLATEPAVHQIVGVNNLEIKPKGTYCFYLEATDKYGSTYEMPAEIEVTEDDDGDRVYFVKKAYFSDGDYIDMEDEEIYADIDEEFSFEKGRSKWSFVLLNEHAYCSDIEETNLITPLSIIFLVLQLACLCLRLFIYIKYKPD